MAEETKKTEAEAGATAPAPGTPDPSNPVQNAVRSGEGPVAAAGKVETVGNTAGAVKGTTESTAAAVVQPNGKVESQAKEQGNLARQAAELAMRPVISAAAGDVVSDFTSLTVPTPDNAIAKELQARHPEAPLFDPNQVPDHENRVEIGRHIQAIQREHYVGAAVNSGAPVEVNKQ